MAVKLRRRFTGQGPGYGEMRTHASPILTTPRLFMRCRGPKMFDPCRDRLKRSPAWGCSRTSLVETSPLYPLPITIRATGATDRTGGWPGAGDGLRNAPNGVGVLLPCCSTAARSLKNSCPESPGASTPLRRQSPRLQHVNRSSRLGSPQARCQKSKCSQKLKLFRIFCSIQA